MNYKIIETHCHLDYLKAAPLEEILEQSKNEGIDKIITISVEPKNFDAVFELAKKHDNVYFTQGIHPHDAKLIEENSLEIIKARASHPKMVAVGEIGLDYHYNHSPREKQIEVFKSQLQLAIDLDKPVVIHSREADEDMITTLKEYGPQLGRKGVIHSFTSTKELALTALDLGFYLGFNGIITFKKAEEVREVVKICPLDKVLLETDSPFLSPVPFRGKENSPARLPHILEKIAEIKGISCQEVESQCFKNSINLFQFPE